MNSQSCKIETEDATDPIRWTVLVRHDGHDHPLRCEGCRTFLVSIHDSAVRERDWTNAIFTVAEAARRGEMEQELALTVISGLSMAIARLVSEIAQETPRDPTPLPRDLSKLKPVPHKE